MARSRNNNKRDSFQPRFVESVRIVTRFQGDTFSTRVSQRHVELKLVRSFPRLSDASGVSAPSRTSPARMERNFHFHKVHPGTEFKLYNVKWLLEGEETKSGKPTPRIFISGGVDEVLFYFIFFFISTKFCIRERILESRELKDIFFFQFCNIYCFVETFIFIFEISERGLRVNSEFQYSLAKTSTLIKSRERPG